MKHYGVDGINSSDIKCYPPPNENDRKQCEDLFQKEWENNKIWCFGIDRKCTDKPSFISTSDNIPDQCYYKSQHQL